MLIHPKPPCFDGYIPENITAGDPTDCGRFHNARFERVHIPLDCRFIEDGIGDEYLEWNYLNPILIDAPTGSGKSTFVCEKLIRHAAQNGRNLLLVSNRTALVRQQKMKVAKVVSEYDSSIQEIPDDDEIDSYRIWGNVCVCTYQALQSMLNQETPFLSNIEYAVFDEIHFLYSDATFSSDCGKLLSNIPAVFAKAIRVYLTATSWSILNSIINSERNLITMYKKLYPNQVDKADCLWYSFLREGCRKLLHYHINGDFSRYNLHFFPYSAITSKQSVPNDDESSDLKKKSKSKRSELLNILPTPSSENKLLIFVMKRDDGRALEKAWKSEGFNAVFIDRSSKYSPQPQNDLEDTAEPTTTQEQQTQANTAWKNLLREERFEEEVLITTTVLDCGINIHDDTVRNIVCFASDPTSFFQMIGRKRLSPDTAECVDIWVSILNAGWYSRTKRDKQFEIEMADKLLFIRSHQTSFTQFRQGFVTPCLTKDGDYIHARVHDNVRDFSIIQHENLLSKKYTYAYGEDYHRFFRTFWNCSNRVRDQQLFRFDSIGQPYVDQYVLWVVQEQLRYYEEITRIDDLRLVIASWMGKTELIEENNIVRQKLRTFLDAHRQSPILPEEKSNLIWMINEILPIDMPKLTVQSGGGSHAGTVTDRLNSVGFDYIITHDSNNKSQNWWITKYPSEQNTGDAEEIKEVPGASPST